MNDEVFLQANTNTVGVVICLERDADCLAESWTSYVTVVFQLQSGLCLIDIVFFYVLTTYVSLQYDMIGV